MAPEMSDATPPWTGAHPEGAEALGPKQRDWAARETDRQVRRGSFAAPILYPVFTLVFLLAGGYFDRHPVWAGVFAVLTAAVAVARGWFLQRWRPEHDPRPATRRRMHGAHVLVSTALWSAFVCFALLVDGVMWMTLMLFIVGAGSASAISANLAPHLRVAQMHHALIHIPSSAVAFSLGGLPGLTLGAVMFAAMGYQLWEARMRHDEHWQSIVNVALLRERNRANALLRTALDHAAEAIAVSDAKGHVEYANQVFQNLSEQAPDNDGGPHPGVTLPDAARNALARGEPWTGDMSIPDSTERARHFAISASPVRDAAGTITHHVTVRRDVTRQRELQNRLMLADRLASVGTMAGGVAHEINNPLASLLLGMEDMERKMAELPKDGAAHALRELLAEGREAAERVRDIVRQLRLFARQDPSERTAVPIDRVLETATHVAGNEVRHRAELHTEFGSDLPMVIGSEGKLVQVFVNLLVNAAQALDAAPSGDHRITLSARAVEGGVVVRVADTGSGFDQEAIDTVFDPFFTTKPVGEGTGLGLSICHSIVRSVGGHVELGNGEDRGAIVEVHLPAAETQHVPDSGEAGRPSHRAPSLRPSRPVRVLVVDDDTNVGRAVGRALRGHEVTIVGDGEVAVQQWQAGNYDVMLCDLMMPGFTGMDVYQALADLGDEGRIVFMTGGAFTPPMRKFLGDIDNEVLDKPFDGRELREAIEEKATLHRAHAG